MKTKLGVNNVKLFYNFLSKRSPKGWAQPILISNFLKKRKEEKAKQMKLHIFNPENDLALADGGANYCPTPAATQIANNLASLPLWFADINDKVLLLDSTHHEYHKRISSLFPVASPYDNNMCNDITSCTPWGWSAQIKRRLGVMGFNAILPSDENIKSIREISNRQSSIKILTALRNSGIETPALPIYHTNADDVASFINNRPRCVIKAPWSGSGKGIAWGIGRVEPPMENFYKGVIRRQGGVVCEEFLNAKIEFAMEFFADGNKVTFAGYSLFKSFKGSYSGNVLASNEEIETFLSKFIPNEELYKLKIILPEILQSLLHESGYTGYFGIDMMVYESGGKLRLNPCMELNLRMNMGMTARLFFDRYVAKERTGEFQVCFFKKKGEAYISHLTNKEKFPLETENGKITNGYIELSPITEESRYSVSATIYKEKKIEDMY